MCCCQKAIDCIASNSATGKHKFTHFFNRILFLPSELFGCETKPSYRWSTRFDLSFKLPNRFCFLFLLCVGGHQLAFLVQFQFQHLVGGQFDLQRIRFQTADVHKILAWFQGDRIIIDAPPRNLFASARIGNDKLNPLQRLIQGGAQPSLLKLSRFRGILVLSLLFLF